MGTLLALEGAVAQGLLYAIMTLGVYITYKLLDFADLTVDGSFALGGCVSAILITVGLDPFTSLLIATLAGMASGVITGFFNTVFKILKPLNISGDNINHIIRTLRSFLEGFALLVNNDAFGNPISIKDSFDLSLTIIMNGIKSLEGVK